MDDQTLYIRHSYHFQESSKSTKSDVYSKSDLNVASSISRNAYPTGPKSIGSSGEYYKRYEHDEIPVKDFTEHFSESKNGASLTNTDLEKIETRIFNNVSQELQTDNSLGSLESNIKFFKTTVEKIFDNFYTSMRDFEHYKIRFHAILDRSKDGSIDDMEDFIKDMFDHISCSENLVPNSSSLSHKTTDTITLESEKQAVSSGSTFTEPNLSASVLEAYKNDHYLTDSTLDGTAQRGKRVEEIFNIFFLGENLCDQIEMKDRNLLSEINLREPSVATASSTASADNLKKMAAKRLEVERYVRQQNHNIPDRDIPVRVSYAKKDIYLNEDFTHNDSSETSKSLISKICSILCKKFRKHSFG